MNHQGVEPPGIAVRIGLLRAEQPVSGVAQTGYNVSVFIQVIIQRSDIDIHIRMILLNPRNAFRSRNQIYETDMRTSALYDKINCSAGASAGSQHGIQYQQLTVLTVRRQFAIVFHRFQGLWIPIQADMPDFG